MDMPGNRLRGLDPGIVAVGDIEQLRVAAAGRPRRLGMPWASSSSSSAITS